MTAVEAERTVGRKGYGARLTSTAAEEAGL